MSNSISQQLKKVILEGFINVKRSTAVNRVNQQCSGQSDEKKLSVAVSLYRDFLEIDLSALSCSDKAQSIQVSRRYLEHIAGQIGSNLNSVVSQLFYEISPGEVHGHLETVEEQNTVVSYFIHKFIIACTNEVKARDFAIDIFTNTQTVAIHMRDIVDSKFSECVQTIHGNFRQDPNQDAELVQLRKTNECILANLNQLKKENEQLRAALAKQGQDNELLRETLAKAGDTLKLKEETIDKMHQLIEKQQSEISTMSETDKAELSIGAPSDDEQEVESVMPVLPVGSSIGDLIADDEF